MAAVAAVAYAWWVTGLRPFSGLAPWAVAVVALAALQLSAWASEPRADHPTLSSLTNAALDPRPARVAAVVAWLAGAAWLGRR